jgi:uncharacterized glyoxalase superfamily protein PhnB
MPKKITPVLFAAEIEPCIAFWVDRLGFKKTMDVPEGDKLGFAIVQKGNLELMYQSYASGEKDVPALAELHRRGPTFLFVEVTNLEEAIAAVKGVEVTVPERTTFYGSREYGVKDPAGHVILFAQFG